MAGSLLVAWVASMGNVAHARGSREQRQIRLGPGRAEQQIEQGKIIGVALQDKVGFTLCHTCQKKVSHHCSIAQYCLAKCSTDNVVRLH